MATAMLVNLNKTKEPLIVGSTELYCICVHRQEPMDAFQMEVHLLEVKIVSFCIRTTNCRACLH